MSVPAVAPGSQPSAATDAKRRRRATGNDLVSPLADPLFGRRAAAPQQSGQRANGWPGSQEI